VPVATMRVDYQRLRQGKKKMTATKQAAREKAVDELFKSMCKGLKARGQSDSDIFTFTDDEKIKQQNRNNAGCIGSPCNTGSFGTSCDEFPFASTMDGGAGAVFSCIPVLAQNIQGGVISSFKQRNLMQSGQHYQFVLDGFDCATLSPILHSAIISDGSTDNSTESLGAEGGVLALSKRDLIPGGSDDATESYPPLTEQDTSNVVIMSVGDLKAGTYTISSRINQGSISSMRVLDYLGEEFASANGQIGTNGERSLTFTLQTDGVGVGLFMDTQLDTLSITSNMQNGASTSSNTAPKTVNWGNFGVSFFTAGVLLQVLSMIV